MDKRAASGIKQPIQQGQKLPAGVGVIDRGAEHKAVRPFRLVNELVYHIIAKDTLSFTGTAITADAVPDRASTHLDDLRFHSLGVQYIRDL